VYTVRMRVVGTRVDANAPHPVMNVADVSCSLPDRSPPVDTVVSHNPLVLALLADNLFVPTTMVTNGILA
jgi:hypothetical protein